MGRRRRRRSAAVLDRHRRQPDGHPLRRYAVARVLVENRRRIRPVRCRPAAGERRRGGIAGPCAERPADQHDPRTSRGGGEGAQGPPAGADPLADGPPPARIPGDARHRKPPEGGGRRTRPAAVRSADGRGDPAMKADAKKIAVIGASGKAGSRIAKEAADRGHRVTAIVRDRSKIADPRFQIVEKDIFRLTAEDLVPFDAVVNAFGAPPGREQQHVEALGVLIRTLAGASRTRLIVIGGAGSLFVDEAETTRLLDAPGFPPLYLETARQQA